MAHKRANPLQPAEALQFVVDFAQADLGNRSAKKLAVDQVWSFLATHSLVAPAYGDERSLSDQDLLSIQADALAVLRGLVEKESASVAVTLEISMIRRRTRIAVMELGTPHDRFMYRLVRLLERIGPNRLLVCPACRRLFVKVTRKEFCSTRCQSRAYMREYRKRN